MGASSGDEPALSATRKRRSTLATEEGVVDPPELPDPELAGALARLSPAQRAAIVLRFYVDWSVEDTAKALRKRPGTVTALTHQGMTRLRELLVEEPLDD